MALTIGQILTVSALRVMQLLGKNYVVGDVNTLDNGTYMAFMTDPSTGIRVPLCWHAKDELRANSENKKIDLVRALLVNGADSLTDFLREMHNSEEAQDVTYE